VTFRDAGSVTQEIGSDSKKQYVIRPGETLLLLERRPYFVDKHLVSYYGPLGFDPDHPGRSKAHKAVLRESTIGVMAFMILIPTFAMPIIAMMIGGVITGPFYWLAGTDIGDNPTAGRVVALLIYLVMLAYYVVNFREIWENESEDLKKWQD